MADAQAQESYPYTDFDSLYLPRNLQLMLWVSVSRH